MDPVMKGVFDLLSGLGPGGVLMLLAMSGGVMPCVVLLLWYADAKRLERVLAQYGAHQQELARMYENNVELVRGWQRVADSLQMTVVRNTEAMTGMCKAIENNMFCPYTRLEKRAFGPQEAAR